MNSADTYRSKAVELEALMGKEKNAAARIRWGHLAKAYWKLADLADRNATSNLVYEPPIVRSVAQQQQSQKPEDEQNA